MDVLIAIFWFMLYQGIYKLTAQMLILFVAGITHKNAKTVGYILSAIISVIAWSLLYKAMGGVITNGLILKIYMGVVVVWDILRTVWLMNSDVFDEKPTDTENTTESTPDEEKENGNEQ